MNQMLDTKMLIAAQDAAKPRSNLVYLSALDNGITRKLGKKGFLYFDPAGQRIRDTEEIARINALAIPPAYEDVIISTNPLSHLQAIGIDARGRRQYRYHPGWHEERGRTKFDRLVTFGDHLPEIRERIDRDMRSKEMTMNKALAAIVWMLDNLYIRVGNANYALTNGSYGATTLRARHVKADGAKIRFRFKGKSGKEWNLIHSDRRIANVIRKLQDLPGQNLFQYFSEDGGRRTVTSQDVNAYIQETAGEDFSSRQFRTWGATCLAVSALAPLQVADTKRALTLQLNEAIDSVAAKLFNTRAVCRSSYIHPAAFEDFKAGELSAILRLRKTRSERLLSWMDDEEIRVLQWLKAKGA